MVVGRSTPAKTRMSPAFFKRMFSQVSPILGELQMEA